MTPLINSVPGVIAVMAILVAGSLYLNKFKGFKSLGPALLCILMGMLLSNVGITPLDHEVYDFASGHLINLSIVVLLLSTDLKGIRKMSAQPLLAVLLACVSVVVVTVLFGFIFVPMLDEGWKLAGMFIGTYTGGSSNLNAIGSALEASSEIVAAANAADYVVYTPFIIIMMWMGNSLKNFKRFNKFWPYKLEDDELLLEGGDTFLKAKEWSIQDIAWLIAIGFGVYGVSYWLANLVSPAGWAGTFRMLFITTIAIIVAQLEPVKKLRGTMDLGLYLSLFYLSYIGLTVDLREFVNSALSIAVYCFFIIFISLLLHVALCRLFKLKYQFVLVSMQAAVGSSSSASVLAAASGWESLVSVGVVLGVIGNAVGNYLGLGVAHFLRMVMGVG